MQRLCARGFSETSFTTAKYWEQMPNNKELMNYGMSIRQYNTATKIHAEVRRCIHNTLNKTVKKLSV